MLGDLFRHASLKTKLTSVTALIVIGSCVSLSWFFIAREIASMEEELLENGRLAAHNIAERSRHSVLAGDQERLAQLVEGTLTSARVAYVVIADGHGRLLNANGKEEWREFLADTTRAQQLLAQPPRHDDRADPRHLSPPAARIVELRGGELVISDQGSHGAACWLRLITGSSHPFVFHLVEPIRRPAEPSSTDSILSLMRAESDATTGSDSTLTRPVYGYVLLGVSSAQDHQSLRTAAWQVVLIACLVIALSIMAIVYLTRQVTTPLQALTTLANRIAQGDLSASMTPVTQDEVGRLTATFNQMTAALNAHEQDLMELNRTLESRVESRTQDLQRANDELQKLDQLKTALVSNASHELRTPLTSIKVHVKNLLDGVAGALGPDQLATLGTVHDNADRLGMMIDDLLDLSRLQAGKVGLAHENIRPDSLVLAAVESLRHLATEKALTLTTSFADNLPTIRGDRDKLRRVFTNLIDNAIKYTPAKGKIHVKAYRDGVGSVIVEVEDSGYGITPEEADKVFIPFFRCSGTATKTRGSGLGLSIAKELVELHHGVIWLEHPPQHGSRFLVRLPLAA